MVPDRFKDISKSTCRLEADSSPRVTAIAPSTRSPAVRPVSPGCSLRIFRHSSCSVPLWFELSTLLDQEPLGVLEARTTTRISEWYWQKPQDLPARQSPKLATHKSVLPGLVSDTRAVVPCMHLITMGRLSGWWMILSTSLSGRVSIEFPGKRFMRAIVRSLSNSDIDRLRTSPMSKGGRFSFRHWPKLRLRTSGRCFEV
jgi:hypothetical protein